MSRRAWLTPSEVPEAVNCWLIEVPDSVEIEGIIRGCLLLLALPYNWELAGDVTPTEAALMGQAILDSLTLITCP